MRAAQQRTPGASARVFGPVATMRAALALGAVLGPAACSLGSDLDELSAGRDASADSPSGAAGTGGSAGAAGLAGTAASGGATGGADGSDLDAPLICEMDEERCGDACVNTLTDGAHCGACDVSCTAPSGGSPVCVAGQCDFVCGALTRCGSACVDDAADPVNCGACGNECPPVAFGEPACAMGMCSAACDAGFDECGGRCVDLGSDPNHCGECAKPCDTGLVCGAGMCAATCPLGLDACSGACVDTQVSVLHCGACGSPCDSPAHGSAACVAGVCGAVCDVGFTTCGAECVDTATNVSHCGGCGAACDPPANATAECVVSTCELTCGPGFATCGDRCLDLMQDPLNCGGCDQPCAAIEVCSAGSCEGMCGGGLLACSGACVDTTVDPDHCGGCDAECPVPANGTATCSASNCAIACDPGHTNCNGACVATASNPEACGSCTNACPVPANGAATCTAGACGVSCNVGLGACLGACVDLQTSTMHCGTCGNACAVGDYCSNGQCKRTCAAGEIACGGSCVDTRTDSAHCGGCGSACTNAHGTAACNAGVCVPSCAAGWASCDGNPANGCELGVSTDPANCGACGSSCPLAASDCRASACVPRLLSGGTTENHSCAGRPSGAVACWGRNLVGQLGDGTTNDSDTPVSVTGLADGLQAPPHGFDLYAFACALEASGLVACWGSRTEGQLGDGGGVSGYATTKQTVVNLVDAVQLSTGSHHACAVRATGAVVCWGRRNNGRLGNGGTTSGYSDAPVTVTGISTAIQVSAGDEHTCAVLASGQIQCWGHRADGRVGDGTTSGSAATPVAVSGVSQAAQVSAGKNHTCAILRDGAALCWGTRSDYRLGDAGSSAGNQATPVAVTGLLDAIQISAGASHSCGVLESGAVVCWGDRNNGRIGNGGSTSGDQQTPIAVSNVTGAIGVAAGEDHSCAFTTSAVYCWGKNDFGKLGDGTSTDRSAAVAVIMLPP